MNRWVVDLWSDDDPAVRNGQIPPSPWLTPAEPAHESAERPLRPPEPIAATTLHDRLAALVSRVRAGDVSARAELARWREEISHDR